MSREPLRKPNIEHHLFESVEDEVYALRWFLRYHWYLVALLLLGIGLLVYVISPLPPRTVTLAAGEPHSSQDDLGQHYRAFFARHGIELRLVRTNGPVANVGMLAGGEVDAALAISGLPVPADRGIVSLGSVEFEPLWLFYRGEPGPSDDPFAAFAGRTLSIGQVGSGVHEVVRSLVKEHRLEETARQSRLVEMPSQDAAEALRAGRIDGMFLFADMDSPLLRSLLDDPALNAWDFRTAKAIATRLRHATAVVYPMGASSLNPVRPTADVNLVAMNTKVLVREDLHPAIQYLFMMAASDFYDNTHAHFDRDDGFPDFLDHDVRKSDVATKYIEHHSIALERSFPFWVASFLDRAWLLIAALAAVLLPLARLVPEYRKFHFRSEVEDCYRDIRRIDRQVRLAESQSELERARAEFNAVERVVDGMWVPSGLTDRYYSLVGALDALRARLDRGEVRRSPA